MTPLKQEAGGPLTRRQLPTLIERHVITKRRGNGEPRREVWADAKGHVTRYNLAYINREIYQGDNGRVIGYDNAHGYHHRHYFGQVEPIDFVSFEDVEEQFERDWTALRSKSCAYRPVPHD